MIGINIKMDEYFFDKMLSLKKTEVKKVCKNETTNEKTVWVENFRKLVLELQNSHPNWSQNKCEFIAKKSMYDFPKR